MPVRNINLIQPIIFHSCLLLIFNKPWDEVQPNNDQLKIPIMYCHPTGDNNRRVPLKPLYIWEITINVSKQ